MAATRVTSNINGCVCGGSGMLWRSRASPSNAVDGSVASAHRWLAAAAEKSAPWALIEAPDELSVEPSQKVHLVPLGGVRHSMQGAPLAARSPAPPPSCSKQSVVFAARSIGGSAARAGWMYRPSGSTTAIAKETSDATPADTARTESRACPTARAVTSTTKLSRRVGVEAASSGRAATASEAIDQLKETTSSKSVVGARAMPAAEGSA
mmetsp:Transcript_17855/g.44866  ORF Transcript_17855/g.44866 Transcript_17855/m.44866 type:complete len:209 (+) Transcript_17855:446-1072(+)